MNAYYSKRTVTSLVAQGLLVRSRHVALLFIAVLVACPFQNMTHFSYTIYLHHIQQDHTFTSPHASLRMQLHIASLYIRLSV